MGFKGDKMTNDSILNVELLVEKLGAVGNVTSKKMFGGHGLFIDAKMFGLVDSKGRAFLKVNEVLKAEYASHGSEAHSKMPYSSIPENILNDTDELINWAERSVQLVK
jgi:DNA transformation protein